MPINIRDGARSVRQRLDHDIHIYHHHHVTLSARIFLTLSRHTSLSSIAFSRSLGLHPVSAQSCLCSSMWRGPQEYIIYELVPTSPAVSCVSGCLILIVFVMGGRWPYSSCFVGAVSWTYAIFLAAFLCNCRKVFSPSVQLESMWCIHIAVSTRSLLGKNCASFYRSGLTHTHTHTHMYIYALTKPLCTSMIRLKVNF